MLTASPRGTTICPPMGTSAILLTSLHVSITSLYLPATKIVFNTDCVTCQLGPEAGTMTEATAVAATSAADLLLSLVLLALLLLLLGSRACVSSRRKRLA